MSIHGLKRLAYGIHFMALAGYLLVMPTVRAKDKPDLSGIPQAVMDGLLAKFPDAKIQKWTQEKEGDIVIYDFEFKQGRQKLEADVKEDGSIFNWERAIKAKVLPDAVKQAVEIKYPKSELEEIMEIAAVTDGKDALEGYEIVLETADDTDVEITVAPDGRILEDSGEMMPEEE